MVVRDGGIQLLAQGECLLLVSKSFRCRFDLGLDFFPLQLLELQFELGERLLLLLLLLLWVRMSMLRWPWGRLVQTFPLAAAARRGTGLIDLIEMVMTSDRVMVLLLLPGMTRARVLA